MTWIEHDCGPQVDLVQECRRCGEVLMDLRNAATCDGGDPGRWAEGPLYASQGGGVWMAARPDELVEQCRRVH